MHPLLARLSDLLGQGVAVAEGDFDANLWPEEAGYVAKAIPKRQAEFAAGRSAARTAMGMLNHPIRAVHRADDRSPIWPAGLTGSITHTSGLCFAALARTDTIAGLGVDAEQAKPLAEAIRKSILIHPIEQTVDPYEATLIFSAKEATYKALSPWLDVVWGFDAMYIELDLANNGFTAHLNRDAGRWSAGSEVSGIALSDGKHVVTSCALPNPVGSSLCQLGEQ